MVGIGLGIRLIGGKFGQSESAAATPARPEIKPDVASVAPVQPDVKDAPVHKAIDNDDMVPTLKSRLRPEHLEPVRVEIAEPEPVVRTARVAKDPAPQVDPEPPPPAGPTPKELYDNASAMVIAGNARGAVAVYKQAIEKGYVAAHRGLGMAYQNLSMDGLAIESYRRYLALASSASDAAAIRRRIEQLGGQL
jgi:hypothetical protein